MYRDSLLRYLGYANEVGESFRPILPRLVVPSYVVSFGYVGMDTLDKTKKEFEASNGQYGLAANKAFDTLLFACGGGVGLGDGWNAEFCCARPFAAAGC